MEFQFTLAKMPTWQDDQRIAQYLFDTGTDLIKVNPLLGKQITIEFLNELQCQSCGNNFQELFRMGFCKNCFFTSPQAGESIIRPELSRAHEGIENRDLAFEQAYQLQEHIVYLANGGSLKVGVTRAKQMLHRWMDQGASQAMVLARTENRFQAGQIEVALKGSFGDKTPWQRMLKNDIPEIDLDRAKEEMAGALSAEHRKWVVEESELYQFEYPVSQYPTKVKSVKLDRDKKISSVLKGVRGQYLIFDEGRVLNVRAHAGFKIALSFV